MLRSSGFRNALLLTFVWAAPNFAHALTLGAPTGGICILTDPGKCAEGVSTVVVAAVNDNSWLATLTTDLALGLVVPATTVGQISISVATGSTNAVRILVPSPSTRPIPEPRSTALYLIGGLLVAVAIRKQVLRTR